METRNENNKRKATEPAFGDGKFKVAKAIKELPDSKLTKAGFSMLLEGAEIDGIFEGEKKLDRTKVLERQWDYAVRTLKRLQKFDKYGHFEVFKYDSDQSKCQDLNLQPMDFATIHRKIKNREYCPPCNKTRISVNGDGHEGSVVEFSWDLLENDVNLICSNAQLRDPLEEGRSNPIPGDISHEAKRLNTFAREIISSWRSRLERDMRRCDAEERLDLMEQENTEPAVQGWRKTPYPATPYNLLNGYSPASDLSPEEKELVMRKLRTKKLGIQKPQELQNGRDFLQQDVWGLDCFAKRNIYLTLSRADGYYADKENFENFVKTKLLPEINSQPPDRSYNIVYAFESLSKQNNKYEKAFNAILKDVELLGHHNYSVHPKGRGVTAKINMKSGRYVTDYLGALWPAWRWYEKCEAIELLQRFLKVKESLPAFYNILMERLFDDPDGYDLLFVDASCNANFASRLSHSCTPNCATKITVTEGKYRIEMRTIADVEVGEELTHDYHAGTDSIAEYKEAVCLCGSRNCRGSYLYHTHDDEYLEVLRKNYGLVDRFGSLILSCINIQYDKNAQRLLEKYGFKSLLLDDLPDWGKRFTVAAIKVIEKEHVHLMEHILKGKKGSKEEKEDAKDEADGVKHSRVQSLVITLDKIKYFLRKCGLGTNAPPPVRAVEEDEAIAFLWTSETSIGRGILQHIRKQTKNSKKFNSLLNNMRKLLNKKLAPPTLDEARNALWKLRELMLSFAATEQNLTSAFHTALTKTADLIVLYCHTSSFFKFEIYPSFTSTPIDLNLSDMGGISENHLKSLESEFTLENTTYSVRKIPNSSSMEAFARKTHNGSAIVEYMLNWLEPLSLHKFEQDIDTAFGSVYLPSLDSCFELMTGATSQIDRCKNSAKQRSALIGHLKSNPSQVWTKNAKKYFAPVKLDFSHVVLGSPMLDQVLGENDALMAAVMPHLNSQKYIQVPEFPDINWIQCERKSCLKWRKIPGFVNMNSSSIPKKFFCELNIWDAKRASCSVPPETYPEEYGIAEENELPDSAFVPGKKLEVFCPKDSIWYRAAIVKVEGPKVKIHYLGWKSRFDTWLDKTSRFLADEGTHL